MTTEKELKERIEEIIYLHKEYLKDFKSDDVSRNMEFDIGYWKTRLLGFREGKKQAKTEMIEKIEKIIEDKPKRLEEERKDMIQQIKTEKMIEPDIRKLEINNYIAGAKNTITWLIQELEIFKKEVEVM